MSDSGAAPEAAEPQAPPSETRDADPRSSYEARRDERAIALARWSNLDRRLQQARLVVFAIGVVVAFAAFGSGSLSPAWLLPAALVFVSLLVWHDRVLARRDRAERAVAFYDRGLARLDHTFAGQGSQGLELEPAEHPYARDLDLFGPGSLFERLCLSRTRGGEERLASWLLQRSEPADARERQVAASELAPRLDLREDLCLAGDDVRAKLHPNVLRSFGSAPPAGLGLGHRIAAPLLAAATTASALAWLFGWAGPAGPALFTLTAVVQTGFAWRLRGRVTATVASIEGPARELDLLAHLLARIETEPVTSPLLVRLRERLDTEGLPPSAQIHRLHRRVELLDARRNPFFAPFGALLLWTTQLACSIERWRLACGPSLGDWIDSISEFEALVSLAGFTYENPSHSFPDLCEGEPRFAARDLGHPLIPPDRCVRNHVRLGGEPQVMIVSGSNMSGKSTLLRSVGVAAVLAQAGAPVCASALRMSPLEVGASLHVVDSLQTGTSHFYAEITRVRQVVDLAEGGGALLFLLDEIFHGTNSHDRGIGAEAIVRALLDRGAIGLVTTHDLALTRVAEALAPRVTNVHFEDHVEDGRIAFDYRMRKGVVTKSNAIALMRSVGLPV